MSEVRRQPGRILIEGHVDRRGDQLRTVKGTACRGQRPCLPGPAEIEADRSPRRSDPACEPLCRCRGSLTEPRIAGTAVHVREYCAHTGSAMLHIARVRGRSEASGREQSTRPARMSVRHARVEPERRHHRPRNIAHRLGEIGRTRRETCERGRDNPAGRWRVPWPYAAQRLGNRRGIWPNVGIPRATGVDQRTDTGGNQQAPQRGAQPIIKIIFWETPVKSDEGRRDRVLTGEQQAQQRSKAEHVGAGRWGRTPELLRRAIAGRAGTRPRVMSHDGDTDGVFQVDQSDVVRPGHQDVVRTEISQDEPISVRHGRQIRNTCGQREEKMTVGGRDKISSMISQPPP